MSASETSFAPASIMVIPSSEPAMTISKRLETSCSKLGLIIKLSLSSKPIRQAPIGPSKGISEIPKAKEAPNKPSTSGVFFSSTERTVVTT